MYQTLSINIMTNTFIENHAKMCCFPFFFLSESLLRKFVGKVEPLFGKAECTYNVHQLLHLAETARQLGPLWSHSAFVFEGGNGKIVRLITAAKGIPMQIVERALMAQQLELSLAAMPVPPNVREVCDRMLGPSRLKHFRHIGSQCMLGVAEKVTLSQMESRAIFSSMGVHISTGMEYKRFIIHSKIYHTESYTRPVKSNSCYIATVDGNYCKINKAVSINTDDGPACILLVQCLVLEESTAFPFHIKKCFLSRDPQPRAIKADEVREPCLFINFQGEDVSYICDLPNHIERD